MIHVKIVNTFLVNMGKEFVVLLRAAQDERTLPISIGQLEAQSIAIVLNDIPFPRPLTHDLFKSVLTRLNCKFLRMEICDLIDETFYAKLILEKDGKKIEIDSRPSDAIAISLRFNAPIYVAEKVMDEASIIIPEQSEIEEASDYNQSSSEEEIEEEQNLSPLEALQKKLKKAIREEKYEEAAKLRDEIEKIAQSN
jgi:bifunctional DNase/RNase